MRLNILSIKIGKERQYNRPRNMVNVRDVIYIHVVDFILWIYKADMLAQLRRSSLARIDSLLKVCGEFQRSRAVLPARSFSSSTHSSV